MNLRSLILLFTLPVFADSPAPPVTKLCQPGELIAADRFDQADSFAPDGRPGARGWRGHLGEWTIVDGAAHATQEGPNEKRPNGHDAVCEYVADLGDLVLTGEFKLGTSPLVGFTCRDTRNPANHLGRVTITPTAVWIQKMTGVARETKVEKLTKIDVPTDPDVWHKITLEICGDHLRAQIDDLQIEARHERYRDRKGRVGMVARGEGAQFRNVAVWSATPKP